MDDDYTIDEKLFNISEIDATDKGNYEVNRENLKLFLTYLRSNLIFPIDEIYERETRDGFDTTKVTIESLLDLDSSADVGFYGFFFDGKIGGKKFSAPVASLRKLMDEEADVILQNYLNWFWNFR